LPDQRGKHKYSSGWGDECEQPTVEHHDHNVDYGKDRIQDHSQGSACEEGANIFCSLTESITLQDVVQNNAVAGAAGESLAPKAKSIRLVVSANKLVRKSDNRFKDGHYNQQDT